MRGWLAILVLCVPAAAAAHPVDVAAVDVEFDGPAVRVHLDIGVQLATQVGHFGVDMLNPEALGTQAPAVARALLEATPIVADGSSCPWQPTVQARVEGVRLHLWESALCPHPPAHLRWGLPFLEEAPLSARVLGRAIGDRQSEFMLAPGRETIALDGEAARSRVQSPGRLRDGLWLLIPVLMGLGRRRWREELWIGGAFLGMQSVSFAAANLAGVRLAVQLALGIGALVLVVISALRLLQPSSQSPRREAAFLGVVCGFSLASALAPDGGWLRYGTTALAQSVVLILTVLAGTLGARVGRDGSWVRRVVAAAGLAAGVLGLVEMLST